MRAIAAGVYRFYASGDVRLDESKSWSLKRIASADIAIPQANLRFPPNR